MAAAGDNGKDAAVQRERREQAALKYKLKERGMVLIDVSLEPVGPGTVLAQCVPDPVRRATALGPEKVVLIKATVHDAGRSRPSRTAACLSLERTGELAIDGGSGVSVVAEVDGARTPSSKLRVFISAHSAASSARTM